MAWVGQRAPANLTMAAVKELQRLENHRARSWQIRAQRMVTLRRICGSIVLTEMERAAKGLTRTSHIQRNLRRPRVRIAKGSNSTVVVYQ